MFGSLRSRLQHLRQSKRLKRLFRWSIYLLCAMFIFGLVSNCAVEKRSKRTYNSVQKIPQRHAGLLLGTAKYVRGGRINPFYQERINAAFALFQAGKIRYLIISGDNSTVSYDEPTTMKNDLVALGVPASRIFLDYAGFRTLDSVVRAKAIFGQGKITVISQQFHNERAIFLADHHGIDAIGFNACDASRQFGFRTKIREFFARTKVMLDIAFHVKPKFLGEKVPIPSA